MSGQQLYEEWRSHMIRRGIRMVPFWAALTHNEQRAWELTADAIRQGGG